MLQNHLGSMLCFSLNLLVKDSNKDGLLAIRKALLLWALTGHLPINHIVEGDSAYSIAWASRRTNLPGGFYLLLGIFSLCRGTVTFKQVKRSTNGVVGFLSKVGVECD